MAKKVPGFTRTQLERKVKQLVDDLSAEIKKKDRKALAKNLQNIVDKTRAAAKKLSKNQQSNMALIETLVGLLNSMVPIRHIEMLSIYAPIFDNIFKAPKGVPDRVHRVLSYVTLMVS